MTVSAAVPADHPLMVAWTAYLATDEYANTLHWATRPEHAEGSLWAAFEQGWRTAAPTPQAPDAGLRKALESFPSLPKIYQWTGDSDLEALFDNELRHENGKRPVDYLNGWLSMLRPFAFASRDDSWGEMEKLLCIVMRDYVRMMIAAREALSAVPRVDGGDQGNSSPVAGDHDGR